MHTTEISQNNAYSSWYVIYVQITSTVCVSSDFTPLDNSVK